MTLTERRKRQIKRETERDIAGDWRYCGGKFVVNRIVRVNGFQIGWGLTHKFHSLKAVIDTERQYGIPNAEKEFDGDDAFEEALDWIIDKIFETADILQKRTYPFVEGKVRYEMALRGGRL